MKIDPNTKPSAEILEDARLAGAIAGTHLAQRLLRRSANDTVMFELACQSAAAKGAETTVDTLVRFARKLGRSWSEIAAALDVTKQAAHQRYRHLPDTEGNETSTQTRALPAPAAAGRGRGRDRVRR